VKILYITPGCFDKGGISRYSRYQVQALKEIYGQSQVKVLSFLGPDQNSFEEEFHVQYHGSKDNFFQRIIFLFKILQYCVTFRPEIIHIAHVNYAGILRIISYIIKARLFLNIYGLEVWTDLTPLREWGLKNSDVVISDCYATRNYVAEHIFNNCKTDINVIWDCVATDHFYPRKEFDDIINKYDLPDRNKNIIISTLGRISDDAAYKGYERLIKDFSKIILDVKNIRLLLIGRGNLIPYLKDICNELGISDYVTFTGSVSDNELPSLLSYGHIFSLVTQAGKGMGEGLPLTPLEAMACGLPIIVGNQDGSAEAVIENSNGFVVDPANSDESIEALKCLIIDNSLREKMSRNVLDIVEDNFSFKIFKERLKGLYLNSY
jgi:phosphatidylinositol alpha-1,6-mannosyltransferase